MVSSSAWWLVATLRLLDATNTSFEAQSKARLALVRRCAARLDRAAGASGLVVLVHQNNASVALVQIAKGGSSSLKAFAARRFPGDATLNAWAHRVAQKKPRVVAFARDPLERFVSGALEVVARGYTFRNGSKLVGVERGVNVPAARQGRYAMGRDVADPPGAVAAFAMRLFDGRVTGGALEHVAPQWHALTRPRGKPALGLDHLGRVDALDAELAFLFGRGAPTTRERARPAATAAARLPRSLERRACACYAEDACCLDGAFASRCPELDCDDDATFRAAADCRWATRHFRGG